MRLGEGEANPYHRGAGAAVLCCTILTPPYVHATPESRVHHPGCRRRRPGGGLGADTQWHDSVGQFVGGMHLQVVEPHSLKDPCLPTLLLRLVKRDLGDMEYALVRYVLNRASARYRWILPTCLLARKATWSTAIGLRSFRPFRHVTLVLGVLLSFIVTTSLTRLRKRSFAELGRSRLVTEARLHCLRSRRGWTVS